MFVWHAMLLPFRCSDMCHVLPEQTLAMSASVNIQQRVPASRRMKQGKHHTRACSNALTPGRMLTGAAGEWLDVLG